MDLEEILFNRWLEFSGGSRPGTNRLQFCKDGNAYRLLIEYLVDWETSERVNLSFSLSSVEVESLFQGLQEYKMAFIEKRNGEEELFFEWRLVEGRLSFRLRGRGFSSLEGYREYYLPNFRDIILEEPLMQ